MIRKANKDDKVAKLIIQSSGEVFKDMNINFENKKEEICQFLFRSDQNKFSYQNTLVYEIGNEIAGLIIVYKNEKTLIENQKKILELKYNVPINISAETFPGYTYIDSVSVVEKFQGQKIATKLINEVFEKEKKCSLIVNKEKTKTIRFYEYLKFSKVKELKLFGNQYFLMIRNDDWNRRCDERSNKNGKDENERN